MVKRLPILFLQAVLVLIGLLALIVLIRFPMTEGRAADLDLFSIYSDPFILYGYASSIAFFVALYKAYRLLGYIGRGKLYSTAALKSLRGIKYAAIVLSLLIGLAGIYIRLFHDKEDDPAGFLVLCLVTVILSFAVATAVVVLEKILRNAMDMKTENDLTI